MAKIPALDRPGPLRPWWMTAIVTGQTTNARLPLSHLGMLPRGDIALSLAAYAADTASTADADPGSAKLRWDHATQASATNLFMSDVDDDSEDHSALWPTLDVGAHLYLHNPDDLDVWQWWSITSVTYSSGYVKLAVTLTGSAGSFGDGAPVVVTVQQPESGGGVDSVNGQTGAVSLALDDLSDVDASAPTDGYALTWNNSAGKWEPTAPTSGMSNPMTTAGDIIIGGTSGAPQRLAAGTDTYVLTMVSGAPAWAAGGGGGGSPGGSDTQVQFNDGGAFAGDSAFTFDKTAKALSAPVMDFGKGTDIARAATTPIGVATGNFVHLTGTTTITSFGTGTAGQIRYIRFGGAGTLTHNATSLILPGGASITTAANDTCVAISEGGSNWRIVQYTKANGQAVVVAGASVANWTTAISTASPNSSAPVASWAATNAATNVDAAFVAKGNGATLAQVPTATLAGGDKRGIYATDFQKVRSASNQVASGQYSVLVGGEQNAVHGQHAVVAGGYSNSANQQKGFVGAGQSNAAGDHSGVVCGSGNSAVGGQYGFIGGGISNVVDEASSWIPGGGYATTRGRKCVGAWAGGNFSAVGDAQHAVGVLRRSTSDATQTELSLDGASPTWYNRWVLPNNSSYLVRGQVVARQDSTGDTAMWEFVACIKRGASAAATAMVVACTPASLAADSGAATWAVAIDADTTNGSLRFRVTGQAAKSIKWVADILASTELVG